MFPIKQFYNNFLSISKGCSRKRPWLCNKWQIETAVLSMQSHRQRLARQAFRHGQNCPCARKLSLAIAIKHSLHNQGLFLEQPFEILRKMKLTWKNETFWDYFDVININKLKIKLTNFESSRKRFHFLTKCFHKMNFSDLG